MSAREGSAFVLPLLLAFILLGRLLRARDRTAQALRAKSAELRQPAADPTAP
jgi:hypothetical protein